MADMTPKEALIRLREHHRIHQRKEPRAVYINDAFEVAFEALEKQIPKKPKHIHEEYEKHQWYEDEKGNIDEWKVSDGYCNGPMCERCGYSPCVHCDPNYYDDPCIVDKYNCPSCGEETTLFVKRCRECGQALDWSE